MTKELPDAQGYMRPVLFREVYAGCLIKKGLLYYRPNYQGYTNNRLEAGRYTQEQAAIACRVEPDRMKVEIAPECLGGEVMKEITLILRKGLYGE